MKTAPQGFQIFKTGKWNAPPKFGPGGSVNPLVPGCDTGVTWLMYRYLSTQTESDKELGVWIYLRIATWYCLWVISRARALITSFCYCRSLQKRLLVVWCHSYHSISSHPYKDLHPPALPHTSPRCSLRLPYPPSSRVNDTVTVCLLLREYQFYICSLLVRRVGKYCN